MAARKPPPRVLKPKDRELRAKVDALATMARDVLAKGMDGDGAEEVFREWLALSEWSERNARICWDAALFWEQLAPEEHPAALQELKKRLRGGAA